MSTKTEGATIFYTMDGTTPTAESTKYDGTTVEVNADTIFLAIAVKDGIENSPVSYAKVSITVKAIVETGEPLSISLESVPNGAQNNATNTSVTVTAKIKSASKIKKVVWKKDGTQVAANLLADKDAQDAQEDENENSIWKFTISAKDESANGMYTVAALDVLGREETNQILISNFDFSGPAPISVDFSAYDEKAKTLTLTWSDPKDANEDVSGFIVSGFKNITITYKESGAEDSTAVESTVEAGKQSFTTGELAPDKTYTFTLTANDLLGNKSSPTVADRKTSNTDYKIGEIMLADGTKVSRGDYTSIDSTNPPVAVIAGFNDAGDALGLGLYKSGTLAWSKEYTIEFPDIVCIYSAESEKYTFSGDLNGSDNWNAICASDSAGTADAATNYPAFNWANTYGTTYKEKLGAATGGWFIPSVSELYAVYENLAEVKQSLEKIKTLNSDYTDISFSGSNNCYWSSNIPKLREGFSNNSAIYVDFSKGSVGNNGRTIGYSYSVLAVRVYN